MSDCSGHYRQAVYVDGRRYWFCVKCADVQRSFLEAK